MRSLYPALLASLLALSPLACKRNTGGGGASKGPTDSTTARPSAPTMPKPLDLPATPQAVVHVDVPKDLLAEVLAYSPNAMTPRQAVAQALKNSGRSFETQVFQHIGLGRAWNMATVKGQTIVHVPVKKAAVPQLAAMLSKFAPEGDFGAVRITRPQGEAGPKLAFLDKGNAMLTLADDLRGIATGPELGRKYGKQDVNITVTKAQAARYGGQLGAERATVTGSIANLKIELEGAPPIPADASITEGALTGLIESKQIAVGATTKYVDFKKDVDGIISRGRRQVSSLPGLAQGNAKELLNRGAGMMRTWNGRSMVGVGPANHVLLGFGANDPSKMSNATLYFIRGVQSNIKTIKSLRSFGVKIDVPSVSFAANKMKVGNEAIHVVALENASKYVPADLRALLTENNRLRIAMAFPSRAGAGMVVVGRNADTVLAKWLEDTKGGTPAGKSQGHLAAGTVAVGPKVLQRLGQSEFNPQSLLGLSANRPPTKIIVKRQGQNYVIKLERSGNAGGRAKVSTP
ncbi:MAG: hypothetical protein ACE37F_14715 [Nannocystaceae bacterium]|nr:hypothetical protein [bacterium]